MAWAIIGLVVAACIVCVAGPLAGLVVVGQVLDRMERRAKPMLVERRAAPVLVADEVASGRAAHDRAAQDRKVNPRDAARTEHLLRGLIATSGLEDW